MNATRPGPSIWDRFEAEPGHDAAVECARLWLDNLPSGLGPDDLDAAVAGRGSVSPTLAAQLRKAGLNRWAEIVDAQALDEESLEATLAKSLLFRAGLGVAASCTGDDFLDIAKAAFDQLRYSEHSAPEGLAEFLSEDPKARARFEAALAGLIDEGRTDPNRLAWRPRLRELEPLPPTTQNLWSSAYAQALIRHSWAYAALRVDPAAFTRLLHAMPIGLAHTTVMFSSDLELEELAKLIRAAPSAFSDEGAPAASGALYALLEGAHQRLAKVEDGEIGQSVGVLVDAVLSRDDAPWLGRAWGQRVLWEVSHRNLTRKETWPGLLFNALTKRLEPLPEEDSRAWIRAERLDLWQVDRVLVEAAILLDHDRLADGPRLLGWALAEGRATVTGRERALDPASFEADLVRQVFVGRELHIWFERVWTAGYAQRERYRIGAYRAVDDTARASLCWALAALNAEGPGRSEAWDAIFLALREIYLLDESYNWIGEVGPAIFRFAAILCTALAKRGELGPDRLVAFLELVVEPTLQFGSFIAVMVQQDEAPILSAAMALVPGQVKWALESGVLAVPPAKSQLTAEALERVKAFAANLPSRSAAAT